MNIGIPAPTTTPTKEGYVFDGWYTSAQGTDLYDWNNQITEDTVIYAHWTQNILSYVVHYYKVDTTEPVASLWRARYTSSPSTANTSPAAA